MKTLATREFAEENCRERGGGEEVGRRRERGRDRAAMA